VTGIIFFVSAAFAHR